MCPSKARSHESADQQVVELARILALGVLRLIRAYSANSRDNAQLQPPNSSLSPGYRAAPE
jgi:hypothetical protein